MQSCMNLIAIVDSCQTQFPNNNYPIFSIIKNVEHILQNLYFFHLKTILLKKYLIFCFILMFFFWGVFSSSYSKLCAFFFFSFNVQLFVFMSALIFFSARLMLSGYLSVNRRNKWKKKSSYLCPEVTN